MPPLPPDLLQALRADEPDDAHDAARLRRLAASIDHAAAPLLDARRLAPPAWWDLPAAWAATLIPASLILAAASIIVLWRVSPPRAVSVVDLALAELVESSPR